MARKVIYGKTNGKTVFQTDEVNSLIFCEINIKGLSHGAFFRGKALFAYIPRLEYYVAPTMVLLFQSGNGKINS